MRTLAESSEWLAVCVSDNATAVLIPVTAVIADGVRIIVGGILIMADQGPHQRSAISRGSVDVRVEGGRHP